jgi:hypothetical protein
MKNLKVFYPILLLFVVIITYLLIRTESFQDFWNSRATRFECPTRNMSYDLRGDILMDRTFDLPIQSGTIGPVEPESCAYRKSLFI